MVNLDCKYKSVDVVDTTDSIRLSKVHAFKSEARIITVKL